MFVYVDKVLYHFNGVYWEIDSNGESLLNNFIKNDYHTLLMSLLHDFDAKELQKATTHAEVHTKKIQGLRKSIDELRHFKKREAYLKDILNSIAQKIEFDQQPHLFAFNNKIYDLHAGEFVDPNPLDYISLTSGYNYDEMYILKQP
jgi:phage/plasmid-associated DNA primase